MCIAVRFVLCTYTFNYLYVKLLCAPLWSSGESQLCTLRSTIPGRLGIFNRNISPWNLGGRDGGVEPQSLVSVPNLPELNPKYLCSASDMKLTIRLSDGDNLAASRWFFQKSRLMTAPGFPITITRLIFIAHTLHHNTSTTLIHIHSS